MTRHTDPDCACKPCQDHRAKVLRDAASAEAQATMRATARALVKVMPLLARGTLSGPDVLRNLVGTDDALRVLRMAGQDAGPVAASWADAAPARPAQSKSDFWGQFPDHDGDFVAGRRSLPEVAAEYEARQRERPAQRQSSVMWRTRDGAPVMDGGAAVMDASYGPSGAPVQRSTVFRDVPELGSEEV